MALPTEQQQIYVAIWSKVVETQMHFNEMSVKSRQFGLGFVSAALGLGIVLLGKDEDYSIPVTWWGGFDLHLTRIGFGDIALLLGVGGVREAASFADTDYRAVVKSKKPGVADVVFRRARLREIIDGGPEAFPIPVRAVDVHRRLDEVDDLMHGRKRTFNGRRLLRSRARPIYFPHPRGGGQNSRTLHFGTGGPATQTISRVWRNFFFIGRRSLCEV